MNYLIYQVKNKRGKIEISSNIHLHTSVIFQGKGKLILDDDVTLGIELGGSPKQPILLQPRGSESIIIIGKGTFIANGTDIIAKEKISIGANCLIGARTTIIDSDFHGINVSKRNTSGETKSVFIDNNVWLGIGVTILKGVNIGYGAIVGAGTVVTKDIPNFAIVIGNPMKIIGYANE